MSSHQKLVVASKNPIKIQAALQGCRTLFPTIDFYAEGISTPSGVREQPASNEETFQGAVNRAQTARLLLPQADFWVGIEGGVEEQAGELAAFAWVVVLRSGCNLVGKGRTGTFFLPPQVAILIQQGKELGEADDIVFNRQNSKQEEGAVGLLTGSVIDRLRLYEHAVILALIPFRRPDLYDNRTP
jgi:inosine/xanthosine triphosphatase